MKKSPEQIITEANFHLEAKSLLLKAFHNSSAFKNHIRTAIKKIKLEGKSMLTGIKKISTNIFS